MAGPQYPYYTSTPTGGPLPAGQQSALQNQHRQQNFQYGQEVQHQVQNYQAGPQPHSTTPNPGPSAPSGSFMNQVNQAVKSSKPLFRDFTNRLNQKLDDFQNSSPQPSYQPQAPTPIPSRPQYGSQIPSHKQPHGEALHGQEQYLAGQPNTSHLNYPGPTFTAGKQWSLADPITEQPTAEFLIIAKLFFESMHKRYPPGSSFVTAKQFVQLWKDDGTPAEIIGAHRALFEYDSYKAVRMAWSLQGIPHVLIPSEPMLIPAVKPLASPEQSSQGERAAPSIVIPPLPTATSQYPAYVPALPLESYIKSVFLDSFHKPEALPSTVRKLCGDMYDPTRHPNIDLYDPRVLPDLLDRVNKMLEAVVEKVLTEVAKEIATEENDSRPKPAAAPADQDMTALEAQLQMQRLQTMMHGGQSFNAGASDGMWVHRY